MPVRTKTCQKPHLTPKLALRRFDILRSMVTVVLPDFCLQYLFNSECPYCWATQDLSMSSSGTKRKYFTIASIPCLDCALHLTQNEPCAKRIRLG